MIRWGPGAHARVPAGAWLAESQWTLAVRHSPGDGRPPEKMGRRHSGAVCRRVGDERSEEGGPAGRATLVPHTFGVENFRMFQGRKRPAYLAPFRRGRLEMHRVGRWERSRPAYGRLRSVHFRYHGALHSDDEVPGPPASLTCVPASTNSLSRFPIPQSGLPTARKTTLKPMASGTRR